MTPRLAWLIAVVVLIVAAVILWPLAPYVAAWWLLFSGALTPQ